MSLPAFRKGECPKCGEPRRLMRWCDDTHSPSLSHRRACPPPTAEGERVEHIHHRCGGCGYDDVTATREVARVLLREAELAADEDDADPHLAVCPACGAPIGSLCRDETGKPQSVPHPARKGAKP